MIKLADTLTPMSNDFYAVESENVGINIDGTSKSIQQAYEDGDLSGGGSSIQVDTMPIASEYPNEIVQYVGESGTYQNGYFYQSTSDEQNPPTYSWVQKNVQPNAESFTFNEDDFNIDSSTDKVSLLPSRRVFNGSKADWDLLSVAEKTQYGATAFTDDEGSDSCPRFPNYANQITIPDGTTSWTATEDCYVIIAQIFTQGAVPIKIDNVTVGVSDTSAGLTINNFSGYLKKGQTISYEYLAHAGFTKIFPLL